MKRIPEDAVIELIYPSTQPLTERQWLQAKKLVSRGRGSLSSLVGDIHTRTRFFWDRINWDRVILASANSHIVGFLGFHWEGRGPYTLTRLDFCREFGVFSGFFRWLLHFFVEWRIRRFEFYIYGLKVHYALRRRNIGSALMLAAEKHALALGARTLELEVHRNNRDARVFYKALGFLQVGEFKFFGSRYFFGFSAVLHLIKSIGHAS